MNSTHHPAAAMPTPNASDAPEVDTVETADPKLPVLDTERSSEQDTFRSERSPSDLEREAGKGLGELLPTRQPDGWTSHSL